MDPLHLLWTDWLIWLLVLISLMYAKWGSTQHLHVIAWRQVITKPSTLFAIIGLLIFVSIALLDSIHWAAISNTNYHTSQIYSLIDQWFNGYIKSETTYSLPLATKLFNKNIALEHIQPLTTMTQWAIVILQTIIASTLLSIFISKLFKNNQKSIFRSLLFWLNLCFLFYFLVPHYHIFGTDQVGHDIFYQCIKSIRTGLIIGGVSTLFMLPFAIFLGLAAGFFGGIIDDIIQVIYTTLSSIPTILLITACILSLQIYMSIHATDFTFLIDRADLKMLGICLILGITGWTPLARLLRAETFKIKQSAYIDAARLMGTSNIKTLFHHLLPNVMHLILMIAILDFSGLVLAESVLSYIGVGVDPSSYSWGNIINAARLELARDPVVWWPLLFSFITMTSFVLAANILADAIRVAFTPGLQKSTEG